MVRSWNQLFTPERTQNNELHFNGSREIIFNISNYCCCTVNIVAMYLPNLVSCDFYYSNILILRIKTIFSQNINYSALQSRTILTDSRGSLYTGHKLAALTTKLLCPALHSHKNDAGIQSYVGQTGWRNQNYPPPPK